MIGPVPSVAKALPLIEEEAIEAAVLDVNLGEENSFPIARSLQAAGVPFLFSTGYNSADIPIEWKDIPVSMKPLRTAAVEQLLGTGRTT